MPWDKRQFCYEYAHEGITYKLFLTMHKFPLLSGILSDLEPMFGLQPTTWELQTRLSIYSEDMEENNQHVLFKLHRSIESIQTWYCTVNEQDEDLKIMYSGNHLQKSCLFIWESIIEHFTENWMYYYQDVPTSFLDSFYWT